MIRPYRGLAFRLLYNPRPSHSGHDPICYLMGFHTQTVPLLYVKSFWSSCDLANLKLHTYGPRNMVPNQVKWRSGSSFQGCRPHHHCYIICAIAIPTPPMHAPVAPLVPTLASGISETTPLAMDVSNATLQAQVARLQEQVSMLQCSGAEGTEGRGIITK